MSQQPDGQFRGRIDPNQWGWGRVVEDRPRLPWFGVFLVLLGGLLLVEQLVPGARAVGSALVVAVGVALLIAWVVNRQIWQLYAGAILTALTLPSLLQDLNLIAGGQGWGTLFLGIALLLIAGVRAASGGGAGWQIVVGGILAVLGGVQVAERVIPNFPSTERLLWPAVILIVGVMLLVRGLGRSREVPPNPPR
jgi:hypothetical protein